MTRRWSGSRSPVSVRGCWRACSRSCSAAPLPPRSCSLSRSARPHVIPGSAPSRRRTAHMSSRTCSRPRTGAGSRASPALPSATTPCRTRTLPWPAGPTGCSLLLRPPHHRWTSRCRSRDPEPAGERDRARAQLCRRARPVRGYDAAARDARRHGRTARRRHRGLPRPAPVPAPQSRAGLGHARHVGADPTGQQSLALDTGCPPDRSGCSTGLRRATPAPCCHPGRPRSKPGKTSVRAPCRTQRRRGSF